MMSLFIEVMQWRKTKLARSFVADTSGHVYVNYLLAPFVCETLAYWQLHAYSLLSRLHVAELLQPMLFTRNYADNQQCK